MKIEEPKEFQIKISNCGTNSCNGTYSIWKMKDALKLMDLIVNKTTIDFVGEESSARLRFDLACLLLSDLNGWDKEMLEESIIKAKERYDKWVFKNKKSDN